MDVAFLGRTVYVLVILVGPAFGQADVVNGLYRIDRDGAATAIADVGAWPVAHPPQSDFLIASGVQYALQTVHGGLLVSDGHHNRVLRVSPDGDIRQLRAIGNEVPTGLDTDGKRISEHRERLRLVAKPGDAPGTVPRRIAISAARRRRGQVTVNAMGNARPLSRPDRARQSATHRACVTFFSNGTDGVCIPRAYPRCRPWSPLVGLALGAWTASAGREPL